MNKVIDDRRHQGRPSAAPTLLAAGVRRAAGDPRPSYTVERCGSAVVRTTRDPEPDYVPFRHRQWDADAECFAARPFPPEAA